MAATSIPHRFKYDVFLSFRGEDIRKNFMDHMFNDFKQKGIHAFRDDNELPKGEYISPHIYKAIEESRFLIVIFSKDYASSSWCLRELVKILECKHVKTPEVHEVQIIFHDVKPDVVRKQTGSYAEAVAKHDVSNRTEVDKWREALSMAANLSGCDLQDMTNGIGARSREKNDVHARMGPTLIKPGTIGKISLSDRVIGEGDKNTVLVEGGYQQPALIVCFEKGQSDDDVFKKEVSIVSNVCDANHNFVKVYGVASDRDFNYVATEHCGSMGLREFILSSPANDHMILLKLISGIVTGIVHLHAEGIFIGNLDLGDIYVDKYYNAKISVITTKTKFPLISSSKGATDDMLALDMLALGHIIFFCFTGVEYDNENLNNPNLEIYLKPVSDFSEALDLLRELLDKHPAQRRTALQVRNHPLLWDPSKKLEFIRAASDHLQGINTSLAIGTTTASIPIDDIREIVFGKEWSGRLDKEFLDAMENDGKRKHIYKYDSMYALLRIIRDLKNHEEKIETQLRSKPDGVPKEVLEIFQPGGTESYFFKRYPKLVMEVYNLMKQHCDENTKIHKLYFK